MYHVIVAARSRAKAEEAVRLLSVNPLLGTVDSLVLDVTEPNAITAAANQVEHRYGRLDILVHNAGIFLARNREHGAWPPSPYLFREVLETNAIGPMAVTEAFLPLMRRSIEGKPRLVFVTSSTASIGWTLDPASTVHRAAAAEYRASKAALNMLMVQYHLGLKDEGFVVHGADPGLCATNLSGNPELLKARGADTAEAGGEMIAAVVKGERDGQPGRVHGSYGVREW